MLAEENLTFDKALKIAKVVETAERDSRGMQDPSSKGPNPAIHALSTRRPNQRKNVPPQLDTCYRCGGKHNAASCKYKGSECHFCGKKGHLAKVCKSKARAQQQHPKLPGANQIKNTHQLTDNKELVTLETNEYSMFHSTCGDTKPYVVNLQVNGIDLVMEVDTGAALSVITEQIYNNLWSDPPQLQASSSVLKTYTGKVIRVKGLIQVDVIYKEQKASLSLIVTLGKGPSLLGQDWLLFFRLDWQQLNQVY